MEGAKLTREDVKVYLQKAVQGVRVELIKNPAHEFGRAIKRFDFDDTEALYQEYQLVKEKRSSQPQQVRKLIDFVGRHAVTTAMQMKIREALLKGQQSEAPREPVKKEIPKRKRTKKSHDVQPATEEDKQE